MRAPRRRVVDAGGLSPLGSGEPRPGRAGGSRPRTVGRMPPATSDLAAELAPGLLDRFVRYARVATQAGRNRTHSPSTPGQLDLGRMLVEELREAGLEDAVQDG